MKKYFMDIRDEDKFHLFINDKEMGQEDTLLFTATAEI
jgi:hypothetical protein